MIRTIPSSDLIETMTKALVMWHITVDVVVNVAYPQTPMMTQMMTQTMTKTIPTATKLQ